MKEDDAKKETLLEVSLLNFPSLSPYVKNTREALPQQMVDFWLFKNFESLYFISVCS